MIGQTLKGRYKIISKLGQGGFGETYLAEDLDLPGTPQCVVKHLRTQFSDPFVLQKAKELFDAEAEVLYKKLGHHDQIPQLLAHFEEERQFYLVQELIEGEDLSKELIPGKQFSEMAVIAMLQDILKVLEFVHARQVIHRDLKPANLIRRARDGKIVLIDFGAVKQIRTLAANTQGQIYSTVAIGTPGYMPCEQSMGNSQFNSDIYALGIIGIQALTGILPTKLPTAPKTHEIRWRDLVQVNPKLADILDKMVRYDFRDRYQSATQVLQALNTLQPQTKPIPWKPLVPVGVAGIAAAIFFAFLKSETLLTYDNSTEGIKLTYPASWSNTLAVKDPITGDLAKFVTPKESETDKLQEDLTISVEDLSNKPTTLDGFTEFSISQIKQLNPDANIIVQGETTLANNIPSYQVIYTVKDRQLNLKKLQIWLLKNNQAYTITYTAESDKYAKFENYVKSLLNSLEIK
ncbi:protein kinase [Microseira sp. BLCC-F43]|jgi:serine/threonine-protein kinase|uniref:protein kinase domain-containing protein n=1 Tax=Microseira sp. BLCC-F43 TaxID=3153602 RepID=UPI0035B89533